MSAVIVNILESSYITHDVKRFAIEKPPGFDYEPGQGADLSINIPEWKDKRSPFTFTGYKDADYLEFMIKIYNDHQGVTNKLGKMNSGELILHEVFGSITYKGPGVFIAGGSGVTPFIAILRNLYKGNNLKKCKLILSNKTSEDVILDEELTKMLKGNFIKIFTRENNIGFMEKRVDENFLIETIRDFGQNFYVCGPDAFVKDVSAVLVKLGASQED